MGIESARRETRIVREWPEVPEGWRACGNYMFIGEGPEVSQTYTSAPADQPAYAYENQIVRATLRHQERFITEWQDVEA